MRPAITLLATATAAAAGVGIMRVSVRAPSAVVEVQVRADDPYNVFVPGESFTITVEPKLVSGAPEMGLSYQWVDFRGLALTSPLPLLLNEATVVESPSSRMDVGYYGLRLLPDDGTVEFNPESGLRREIGFAVLPVDGPRQVDLDARFGIVHFDDRDPYLNPGWMKTATEFQVGWNGSGVDPEGWRSRLARDRERGQIELPLIFGETWQRGSLQEIRTMMGHIFRADPRFDGEMSVPVYELGLEENLGSGSFAERLALTADKFRVVGEERDHVDPRVKLAYQIAGTDMGPYRRLLRSELGREIDILSAHPYPWSDWPTPDSWHDEFVNDLRALMANNGIDIPIWYTEVGSSQNDAEVPAMYSGSRRVGDGQTRAEYAAYLVKMHTSALDNGIEKVFWYNYQDRDTSTTNAEDHFGLRDYWGHPKPGYLAYAAMLNCMKGRESVRLSNGSPVRAYLFRGVGRDCLVAWLERDVEEGMPLESVWSGLVGRSDVEALDLVGTPLQLEDGKITLSTYPTFVLLGEGGENGATGVAP